MSISFEIDFATKSSPDRVITVHIEANSEKEALGILESEYKVRWIFNTEETQR